MKRYLILLFILLFAGCAAAPPLTAQSQPGTGLAACTLDGSHVAVYDSPTVSCQEDVDGLGTWLAATAPFTGTYLELDASNGPVTGDLTFNEDVVIIGTLQADFLTANALTNRVGVGTSTPSVTFEVLGETAFSLGDFTADSPTFHVDSVLDRVGVGTLSPSFDLHIVDATNPTLLLEDSTTPAQLYVQAQNTIGVVGTLTNHALRLVTDGSSRVTITSAGNMGVGDTSPDETLEVVGTFGVSAAVGGDGDRFQVDSSGDVGIGTVTPDGRLHVFEGSAGTVTANTAADDVVAENSASGGFTAIVPDASSGHYAFASPSDNFFAYLSGNYSSGTLGVVNTVGDIMVSTTTAGAKLCYQNSFGSVCDHGKLATAPTTCTTGDTYTDTSPAKCWCSATNTWAVIVGTSCT